MPEKLDERADRLLRAKNMAHLSVLRKDGTVHAAVVWTDVDDEGRIVINSAEGRLWPRLLRNAGEATLSVHNIENPYEYAGVRARLVSDSHDDADAVIDALAKKYLDADSYPFRVAGEQRVTFRLAPERVWGTTP
jgi:PPOX class probable F420-dependent enzyme